MLLTRRELLRIGSLAVGGYEFLQFAKPVSVRAAGRVKPRGSARFCIFVMLDGGQSHVDAWDVKEGRWTPQHFDIRQITPEIKMPCSLYGKIAFNEKGQISLPQIMIQIQNDQVVEIYSGNKFEHKLVYPLPPWNQR